MAMNRYQAGDRIIVSTSTPFQILATTTDFDPTTVTFSVREPGADVVEYVYGTDSEVAKVATGNYTCTFDVETPGRWTYSVRGEDVSGENRGSDGGEFYVQALP